VVHVAGVPEELPLEDEPPHARTKRTRLKEEDPEKRIPKIVPPRQRPS
jgi:hypothetical protein